MRSSMNLYEIRDVLAMTRMAVLTPRDIARVTGFNRTTAYVIASRMLKRGLLRRVEKGRLSLSDDPFIVSSQLVYPSYISFATALYIHGRFQQTVDVAFVVTSRRHLPLRFEGMRVEFVRMPPRCIFGFRKVQRGSSYIMLADVEKAIVDILCRPRYTGVACTRGALEEGIDVANFERYVLGMNEESVLRRAGYLLDSVGIEHSLRPRTRTPYLLNPSLGTRGKYEKEWRLYVNEVV